MKTIRTLAAGAVCCFFLPAWLGAQASPTETHPLLDEAGLQTVVAELETLIPQLIKEARIPGLQVALIRDGKIAWHRGFGVKNAQTQEPVTGGTIFEAASLTKPFFAFYAVKLAEQGVISLDKPILSYLPRDAIEQGLGHSLDEKGFHRDWLEKITARHVLSHSSGMPHGEGGRPYPLFFEPGTKWKYSADGYFFLQKGVEALKGDRLENLIQKEVLDPLGMTHSCLVWRDDYEKTMANGHGFFGKPEEFRKRTEAHAAATLYTTAEDYARFVCAVLNGDGLRPETLKEMLTPQIDMNKDKGLGWSLGFGTQDDANGRAIWQWGDYGIFRNYIIAYPQKKTGVVYLTNSHNGLSICPALVAHSVGGQATGCRDLNYRACDSLAIQLAWELKNIGPKALDELPKLSRKYPGPLSADDVSYVAYVLNEEKLTAETIALLEYNVREHPQSGSARLELARAYLEAGQRAPAKAELEKAREAIEDKVEPGIINWNLEYLRALDNPARLGEDDLKKLAGDYGPRHVQFKDGRLLYRREGGTFPDFRPLVPMSKDTFVLEGLASFKMKFEFDGKGNAIKIVGLYDDGRRDESVRNKLDQ
jgi:CubicO group peptidase (beta-lactamase class C family)